MATRQHDGARQPHGRGERRVGNPVQCAVPRKNALLHHDFRVVCAARCRTAIGAAVRTLVKMRNPTVMKRFIACMGMDERRYRLQGDEQSEHQDAGDSVRHGQTEKIYR